tara:strand:- start:323 stop:706 length:384 start_codon:yes stop_codon:yes gene_type:complete
MHSINKNILFVLLTIMAYLPMTVVNAMPNVGIPVQTHQSATSMQMMTMEGMESMADANCHPANKTCDHCSNQNATHCANSACSVSVAITTHYPFFSINRHFKNSDKVLRINTQFQEPSPPLRPPISI